MSDTTTVRPVDPADEPSVRGVVCAAFGSDVEYGLIEDLKRDSGSWMPELSLGAYDDTELVGHILFTRARVGDTPAVLLAPLAVIPSRQGEGIGLALVRAGLEIARESGAALALVLGHPGYYPRAGFEPAYPHAIEPPYPVDPPEAWMVSELQPGALSSVCGAVEMSDVFLDPALWRE